MGISRIKRALLVLVLFILPFASVGQILLPSPVSARGTWDSQDIDQQLKTYMNYFVIDSCMRTIGRYTADQAARDEGTGRKAYVGVFLTNKVGAVECKTGLINAVKNFGYPSIPDALTDWGYTLDGNSYKNGDGANRDAYRQQKLKDKMFGGHEPSLTAAQRYRLIRKSLDMFCGPSNKTAFTSASKATQDLAKAGSGGYLLITDVDASGTSDNIYKTSKKDTDTVTVYPVLDSESTIGISNISDGLPLAQNCAQMASATKKYAKGYSAWIQEQDPETKDQLLDTTTQEPGAGDGPQGTTCSIPGLGWIICPIMTLAASLTDASYGIVGTLLTTNPIDTTTDGGKNLNAAWAVMRNIANVVFIIAFMIIIFSQITSIGLSNYGVKKMLPRIIIAAILVNLSYYICAIAVDLSNILGTSTKEAFDSIGAQIPFQEGASEGSLWGGLVAGVLGASAIAYADVTILLPMLIAALAAVVTVFIVLTLRAALIVLLIVVSPLAFVAFLLPNTEEWFTRWRKLFTTMLLMFPAIALIFGASALASKILQSTGGTLMGIVAAGVAVIPLFITPFVMKAAGGVLNRIAGVVNDRQKGIFDRMGNASDSLRKRRLAQKSIRDKTGFYGDGKIGKARSVFNTPRRALTRSATRTKAINASVDQENNLQTQQYVAEAAENNSKFANKMAGGGTLNSANTTSVARVQASAAATNEKAISDAIKNIEISSTFAPGDLHSLSDAFASAVRDGDDIKARAYQNMLLHSGAKGIQQWEDTTISLENSGNMDAKTRDALQRNIVENHGTMKATDNAVMNWALDTGKTKVDANGNTMLDENGKEIKLKDTLEAHANNPSTYNGLSNSEIMSSKKFAQERMIKQNLITPERAQQMLNSPEISKVDKDVRREFEDIAKRAPVKASGGASSAQQQEKAQSQPTDTSNSTEKPASSTTHEKPPVQTPSPIVTPEQPWAQRDSGLYVPHQFTDKPERDSRQNSEQ